ncbi:MAG: exopolysaccharide biosynthesis polyprenyl glycosylphosphotransferase [Chitinivibrionales bacterium]|nr:exopolysaccharide biosynthesis polyprenyl glycosylphosphotransferase [Chitinivibrionales bacterium]MBD3397307.1 exopolysaccharide biosynthesis polyprenyl glycosylphosphotransferase [Chitinivibrionales bacterium]
MVRYRFLNGFMMALGDGACISAGLLVAGALRVWLFTVPLLPEWGWYLFPLWWGGATLMRIVPSWGLGPVEELRRMTILQLFVHTTTAVALLASSAGGVSLLTLGIEFIVSSLCIPLTRIRIKRLLITADMWGVPVIVYGTGDTAAQVVRLLRDERGLGYNPVALVRDDTSPETDGLVEGLRVERDAGIIKSEAPVAIVAMPGMSRERLVELLEGTLAGFYRVMVIPELFEVPSLWVKPRDIKGILGLEITSNLLSPVARFVKAAMDIVLVLGTAPLWAPLFPVTVILIRIIDGANPFFLQERVGKRGLLFRTWKFRTMVPDAEEVLRRRLAQDGVLREEWERHYKLKDDPRVTALGRFLRRLSIDELPQLLNVLRGEMSLVGPRPLPLYHHDRLPARARELRERVRPGLTGLWQVSGRSDRMEDMQRMDSYYVRNWSPWLDIVVLVRTVRAVLKGEGAY